MTEITKINDTQVEKTTVSKKTYSKASLLARKNLLMQEVYKINELLAVFEDAKQDLTI